MHQADQLGTKPAAQFPGVIEWIADLPGIEWDRQLAEWQGHPLQSALWGDARDRAGDPPHLRLLGLAANRPVCLARIEQRRIPAFGQVAWISKGPTYAPGAEISAVHAALVAELRRRGFILALETPYSSLHVASKWHHRGPLNQTLILDLEDSEDAIWAKLPAKVRSQIRSAERKGVVVQETRNSSEVTQFHAICASISRLKGFELPGSRELMHQLVSACPYPADSPVKVRMLIARLGETIVGGYAFFTIGRRTHTIWSGFERASGVSGASDLLVWSTMRLSFRAGVRSFDQEGIDKKNNPSTFNFKRKFCDNEIYVPGLHAYALGVRGALALRIGHLLGKI